jgi:hypothetical protein
VIRLILKNDPPTKFTAINYQELIHVGITELIANVTDANMQEIIEHYIKLLMLEDTKDKVRLLLGTGVSDEMIMKIAKVDKAFIEQYRTPQN